MLGEARRHAAANGVGATWIEARAEDLAGLGLPPARLVTFGQSFHWTEGVAVLAVVHDLLAPGGAVALVAHDVRHGSPPADTGIPPIPHERVEALIGEYLGWQRGPQVDTFESALAASPFGGAHTVTAPGRADLVRTIDDVVANFLSMSFAAPDRFGDRLDEFIADLRAPARRRLVRPACSSTGRVTPWSCGRRGPADRGVRRAARDAHHARAGARDAPDDARRGCRRRRGARRRGGRRARGRSARGDPVGVPTRQPVRPRGATVASTIRRPNWWRCSPSPRRGRSAAVGRSTPASAR